MHGSSQKLQNIHKSGTSKVFAALGGTFLSPSRHSYTFLHLRNIRKRSLDLVVKSLIYLFSREKQQFYDGQNLLIEQSTVKAHSTCACP